MKKLLLIPVLLGLSGCDSLVRKDGDWFEASGHSAEQFERDDSACKFDATDRLAYDVIGSDETSYARSRAFNLLYARCMALRHYRPRSYWQNWLPE